MSFQGGAYPLGQGSVDPDPWPGRQLQSGALNVAPAVGGSCTLSVKKDVIRTRDQLESVVQWRSDDPAPVVLHLTANPQAADAKVINPSTCELIANVVCEAAPTVQSITARRHYPDVQVGGLFVAPFGCFVITYGSRSSWRTMEVDLRSQSVQLPPCDYVQVSAFLIAGAKTLPGGNDDSQWKIGNQLDWTVPVSAAVSPGILPRETYPTWTSRWCITNNRGLSNLLVPAQARWMAAWILEGGLSIDPTSPILGVSQALGNDLLFDYQTGTFLGYPGTPQELVSREPFRVVCTTAVDRVHFLAFRFWLEP